jgi:hypothetical protein
MYGMMQLQRKVKIEKFFGGANHKQTAEEAALGVSNEELTFREKHGDQRRDCAPHSDPCQRSLLFLPINSFQSAKLIKKSKIHKKNIIFL